MSRDGAIRLDAFCADDIAELVPMWRAAFEEAVGVVDPHPLAGQADDFFRAVLPRHDVTVARDGGAIVGFLASSDASVAQLYVRIGWQRRGLGSRLIERAQARSAGSLWLPTFARNARARAFYETHGFRAAAFGFEPSWRLDDVRYEWTRPPG